MKSNMLTSQILRSFKPAQPAPSRAFASSFSSLSKARPLARSTPSLSARVQTRNARKYARPPNRLEQAVIDARVKHPILFPLMLFGSTASVILLIIMAYDQWRREKKGTSVYPPAVEDQLRLALHYTHISPDPETASKYFMQAIKKAEEVGMDPYSKDTVGIRVRFSQMLEEFGHVKAAIEILDGISSDLEQKLAELDQAQSSVKPDTPSKLDPETADLRANMIKGIVKLKIKISSLYESDYLQNPTMAKQVLSDAVGLVVKETKNPQVNTFTEDNGAGLTTGEIAAMLSQMGDLYATSGEEENAIQLYMLTLQPLRASCNGTRSCKEVQVLSNIASAMDMALKKPNAKINGKPATKDTLAAGRRAALRWADQAIATVDAVGSEERDEICTAALISAQMTRADLLLDNGDKVKAREAFLSLLPMLRERNLLPLIETAEQGLKRASTCND
ncbi:uncharacterized protein Z520_05592 [Fonsecaea multimorphosa CBS 102226]|uniref:Uncharacterized protein n=1 Tax=Fonsecaea multimorphosa CBS 102226 TaxID=1442371 RepID=A0A0D2IMM5_9EURO|nr:uncharacterized protein Z520_05592 [Fonsecaea multimorphosa CBS 102226]KIX98291.1 hypothetical protein Z520_05592 [Fonsecaea multimorphosa CBS 102226]OAL24940.1 hypothetical protein AYO22_05276 [Fonsecaea multimorphosa]